MISVAFSHLAGFPTRADRTKTGRFQRLIIRARIVEAPPRFHQVADAGVVEHWVVARPGKTVGQVGAPEHRFNRGPPQQQGPRSEHGEPAASSGYMKLSLAPSAWLSFPAISVAAADGRNPPGHLLGVAATTQGDDENKAAAVSKSSRSC